MAEKIEEMEIRLEHYEQEVEEARYTLEKNYKKQEDLEKRVKELTSRLEIETQQRQSVENKLARTETAWRQTTAVLKATQKTEKILTNEALVLLKALKESVADGDRLYQLVQTNRSDRDRVRKGTQSFVQSATQKLQGAVDNLDQIAIQISKTRSELGDAIQESCIVQLASIEKARGVVADISNTISHMSRSVSDNLSKEILPQVQRLSETIETDIDQVRTLSSHGGEQLLSVCQRAEKDLEEHDQALEAMATDYTQEAACTLSKMEDTILGASHRLKSLLDESSTAIQKAQGRSASTRETFDIIFREWSDSNIASKQRIKAIAVTQNKTLDDGQGSLSGEKDHYISIEGALGSQTAMLDEVKSAQLHLFARQMGELETQRRELKEAKENHKKICDDVIANVMDGVKSLITDQLARVVQEHAKHSLQLEGRNTEASTLNDNLRVSANDVFQNVSKVNESVRNDTKALQFADARVLKCISEGKEAMHEVIMTTDAQEKLDSDLLADVNDAMGKFQSIDDDLTACKNSMGSRGDECVNYLENTTKVAAKEASRKRRPRARLSTRRLECASPWAESVVCSDTETTPREWAHQPLSCWQESLSTLLKRFWNSRAIAASRTREPESLPDTCSWPSDMTTS